MDHVRMAVIFHAIKRIRISMMRRCPFRSSLWFAFGACFSLLFIFNSYLPVKDKGNMRGNTLLVLTIATEETSAVKRLVRTAEIHALPLKVLGMGQKWHGLGQKIATLIEELENHKDSAEVIVLFVDAYDVLFNAGVDRILDRFRQFDARVLFSAEDNCWPDETVCDLYPQATGKRYLNSGLIMGYAPELYKVLTKFPFPLEENDQEYFTRIFLDQGARTSLNIKLDHLCRLFQTFEGGKNNVQLRLTGDHPTFYNKDFDTEPLIVHTPGFCKMLVSFLSYFLSSIWNSGSGCPDCLEDNRVDLSLIELGDYPLVLVSVIIEDNATQLADYLVDLRRLNYPKDKMNLIIQNHAEVHTNLINAFASDHSLEYSAFRLIHFHDKESDVIGHNESEMRECIITKCSYHLKLNVVNGLNDPKMLRSLIEQNRTFFESIASDVSPGTSHSFTFNYGNVRCLNSFDVVGKHFQLSLGMF